jgi:hypothetical protein
MREAAATTAPGPAAPARGVPATPHAEADAGCAHAPAAPESLLLDPGPGWYAAGAGDSDGGGGGHAPGSSSSLAPDLRVVAALLPASGTGCTQPAELPGAGAHAEAMRQAAAALSAAHCPVEPALLRALLEGSDPDGTAGPLDVGSGCLLAPARPGASSLVARSLRTAALQHTTRRGRAPPVPATAAAVGVGHEAGAPVFDLGEPLVGLFPLSLRRLQGQNNSSEPPAPGAPETADALLLVGAHGRAALLRAAPRLPHALGPLLRVLRGGLCVNALATEERQLPLRPSAALLVADNGDNDGDGNGAGLHLALLTARGSLFACRLSPRSGSGGGGGRVQSGLPERLEAAHVPLPHSAATLAPAATPGAVTVTTPAGDALTVPLAAAAAAPRGPQTQRATRARAGAAAAAAALRRLGAAREELQRRGGALDSACAAATQELQLLSEPPRPSAAWARSCRAPCSRGPAAVAPAGVEAAWGGCGALRARAALERVWLAPAAGSSSSGGGGGGGGGGSAALHLAVRAELVNGSRAHALGPGWQLLLQWVPGSAHEPGWQAGCALAPLPPGGAAAASLLLPLWGDCAGGGSAAASGVAAGGWLQLLLVKPGAGCSSCDGAGVDSGSRAGYAVAALLCRQRVGALCLSRLLEGCCPGGFPLPHPSATNGAPTPWGPVLAAALPYRCLMHLRAGCPSGAAAVKRRRLQAGCGPAAARGGAEPGAGMAAGGAAGGAALALGWIAAALRDPAADGCYACLPDPSGTSPPTGGGARGAMRVGRGASRLEAEWGPLGPGPGAGPGLGQQLQLDGGGGEGGDGGECFPLVLRLQGGSATAVAAARGQVTEAALAQLKAAATAAAASGAATDPDSSSNISNGGGGAAAALALESDRARLQEALRRVGALRACAAALRAQLSQALALRDVCDRVGCRESGSSGEAGHEFQELLAAAAALHSGIKGAYGRTLLAAGDAARLVVG